MYFKLLLITLAALTIAGCNHNKENKNQSEPEEVKFQYTAYSEQFELFAESDPFVIGQTANVLSHFSTLPEFTPVTSGAITLRIVVNGQRIGTEAYESDTERLFTALILSLR
ncbi:MAG: hypothetical protein MZV63_30375 [Marinilabiliales bacterium]|nr:hypothetical protein [Marinilabiliales bacterium]